MPRDREQSEQMREKSRQKILTTAQRLFAEKGYTSCNVSDIAGEAGMSQGNIYWYFSSKEEILKTILQEGFAVLGSSMAEAASGSGSGREKLDVFLTNFDRLMRDKGGEEFVTIVMTLIGHGGTGRFSELGLSTEEIGKRYHQSLHTIIAQCQAEGTVLKDIAPDMLSMFFFAFINGLVLMYPDVWKEVPSERIRDAVLRLLGAEGREDE